MEIKRTRNSKQRTVILEELCKLTSHPTAIQLYDIVRKRMPKISLGTVYRNLELMVQNGQVMKLEMGGGESRYDGNSKGHHHVKCQKCGKVNDVHDIPWVKIGEQIQVESGYKINGYKMQFLGICPDCQKETDQVEH